MRRKSVVLSLMSASSLALLVSQGAHASIGQSLSAQNWYDIARTTNPDNSNQLLGSDIVVKKLALRETVLSVGQSDSLVLESRFGPEFADITPVAPLFGNLAITTAPLPTNQVMVNSLSGVSVSLLLQAGSGAKPPHRTIAPDNWQGFNRFVFNVNDKADKLIIKPLAKGYRKVTFGKLRKAMRNLLAHIASPTTLANDILQGNFKRALNTSGRMVTNTLIGFGGIADPAAKLGMAPHTEDFGQTLAVWGVSSGPYVVLPFFGPSTVRDSFGLAIDRIAFSPLNYADGNAVSTARFARTGATLVSAREPFIEPLENIERNSLDFYSSFRSFYLQARRREILNGQSSLEELPDIGDGFDDFDDFDEFEDLE